MAISGVSLASTAKAISSGNLTGAQQALAQLSQTLGGNSNGSNAANANDPLSQALDAIGQALQSGDIGGAQQALAAFQQQTQAGRGHHHHGGHRGGGESNQGANPGSTASSSPAGGTIGINVDVTA